MNPSSDSISLGSSQIGPGAAPEQKIEGDLQGRKIRKTPSKNGRRNDISVKTSAARKRIHDTHARIDEPEAKRAKSAEKSGKLHPSRVSRIRSKIRREVKESSLSRKRADRSELEPAELAVKKAKQLTSQEGNRQRIRSALGELQDIHDRVVYLYGDINAECQAKIDRWTQHIALFDTRTLAALNKDDLYQLVYLLRSISCTHRISPEHRQAFQMLFENLPRDGKIFHQSLDLQPQEFWNVACKNQSELFENRFIALAQYISAGNISFTNIQDLDLSEDDMAKLLPHLRFGDFRGVDDEVVVSVLKKATELEWITIFSQSITELPDLPSCLTLECLNCRNLERLPALPACATLNCIFCTNLKELPALPACANLNCMSCTNLKELPALPACTNLNCSDCENLERILALPACAELICNGCTNLKELPALPACTKLNCSKCSALEALPALPACAKLNCHGCPKLEGLPALPACVELNCSGCPKIEGLPDLPACTKLDCSGCPLLERLPALLQLCNILDCHNCVLLQELPQALPCCEELNCEDCPMLSGRMPELPWNVEVYTGNGTPLDFEKLEVDINTLASHPDAFLLKLGSYLLQNKPFPNIYYQENGEPSEAIDIGGVRRDFISRLIESLFTQDVIEGKLTLSQVQFPTLRNQGEIDCYRTLGRICSLCYPKNSPFKTGTMFPVEVYKRIVLLADPSLAAVDIASDDNIIPVYLHYRGFAGFLHLIESKSNDIQKINDNVLVNAYAFMDQYGTAEEARTYFSIQANRELLKQAIDQDARSNSEFHAVRLIAQEMKNTMDAKSWNILHKEGGDELHDRIEGVISKEALLGKLDWVEAVNVDPQLQEKTKAYLNNWIEHASVENLRKFVRAVTSNNAIGPNPLHIEIVNRGSDFIPVAHTCAFTLELSSEYPDQKTFDTKINFLLTEGMAGSGFQIA